MGASTAVKTSMRSFSGTLSQPVPGRRKFQSSRLQSSRKTPAPITIANPQGTSSAVDMGPANTDGDSGAQPPTQPAMQGHTAGGIPRGWGTCVIAGW